MDEQFYQVKNALKSLTMLQQFHIDAFQTDLMPDLESQSKERAHEFNLLKKNINLFLTHTENITDLKIEPMAVYIAKGITTLLKQNQQLEIKVKKHRDELQSRMKQVSKGKKAIGCYASPITPGNRARVISSTS